MNEKAIFLPFLTRKVHPWKANKNGKYINLSHCPLPHSET